VKILKIAFPLILVGIGPLILGVYLLGAYTWDFTVPVSYSMHDDLYQLVIAKGLIDNDWIFTNYYLGAPSISDWHFHAAAQTSALHSIIMKFISIFVNNSITVVHVYYFLNFSLISLSTYYAFRLAKVDRWLSVSAGYIFAFLFFRVSGGYGVLFLSSYFMVPLSALVVYWSAIGLYTKDTSTQINKNSSISLKNIKLLITSKKVLSSIAIVILTALSDGYYAFFTILLLLFVSLLVVVNEKTRNKINFVMPLFFSFIMLSTALALSYPIEKYKNDHYSEFHINGKKDPVIVKHPFEAEVYSTSLKLILSPSPDHRNLTLRNVGKKIVETNNKARAHPQAVPWGPLGMAGTIFLLLTFTFLLSNKIKINNYFDDDSTQKLKILAILTFFILLSSIYGGIGTMIGLVFPPIRAYDRFTIYLFFYIMLAAYYFFTIKLSKKRKKSGIYILVVLLATSFTIWDQTPYNTSKYMGFVNENNSLYKIIPQKLYKIITPEEGKLIKNVEAERFLAEREIISELESVLPVGATVYQYPFSQFLDNNQYYGHGASGHMRAYLHSKKIHWSNGASRRSPVDIFHHELSGKSIHNLLELLPIYGFQAILIDRFVLEDHQYLEVKNAVEEVFGKEVSNNESAKMAYIVLPSYGFTLTFDKDFKYPRYLNIIDSKKIDYLKLPSYINKDNLRAILAEYTNSKDLKIDLTLISGLLNKDILDAGMISFNTPLDAPSLLGDIASDIHEIKLSEFENNKIILEVKNNSTFDWKLNSGFNPISIGYHIYDKNGNLISWDDGYRISSSDVLLVDTSVKISVNSQNLKLYNACLNECNIVFELVQDGNSWFGVNAINKKATIEIKSKLTKVKNE